MMGPRRTEQFRAETPDSAGCGACMEMRGPSSGSREVQEQSRGCQGLECHAEECEHGPGPGGAVAVVSQGGQ